MPEPSLVETIAASVELHDDGIWRSTETSEVSYPESGHSACLAVEETSFWFNHRNACIQALVGAHPPPNGGPILDVGGGNGYVSVGLAAAGHPVVLIEPGAAGAKNARGRGLDHVICATTDTAGVRPGSVGAIGLFDVVEHIEDDHAFMGHIASLLDVGGRVYATVPAYPFLWSDDDIRAGHHRRYRRAELVSLFESAGLAVDYASFFFRPLPLPVFAVRSLPHRIRKMRSSDASNGPIERSADERATTTARSHAASGGAVASMVRSVLRPEVRNIERSRAMRFGGSLIIAATRTETAGLVR